MIVYATSPADISAAQLHGFFVGWPNSPSPQAHLRILHGSAHVVLALDDATNNVVGFVTAISDGVSCAYIPHLEVLPQYQGQGIGSELMRRMLDQLRELYMIDLLCDPDVQPFYERLGMRRALGMLIRNYKRQNCA
jgi:ribosomal protein S18 acetylase RimI-like enzyme